MPKQEAFFPLFDRHAAIVEAAAESLGVRLRASDEPANAELGRLVDEGRRVATDILARIRSSFVTPFDRSDIKEMTTSMQALLDRMREVAGLVHEGGEAAFGPIGDLIVRCAKELRQGVARLEDLDKHADELTRMRERIGDASAESARLREAAMAKLFEPGTQEPLAVMAAARRLDRLGGIVEGFERVADRIDSLVLDHV